jgi:hypothetical protein
MKISFYVTLAALVAASSGFANDSADIQFNGQHYGAIRLGRIVKVVPSQVTASLIPMGPDLSGPSNPANPGCDVINAEIHRREYLFDECEKRPDQSICRVLIKGLRLLAEGRPDTDTPIDPAAVRSWTIGAPEFPEKDIGGLQNAVAVQFHVKPAAIVFSNTGEQPALADEASAQFFPGSSTERVNKILAFPSQDLARFAAGKLITHNNIFSCDLAAGTAGIIGHSISTLKSIDRVPDPVVDLAWNAYQNLDQAKDEIGAQTSPLVQAALIGYHLNLVLSAGAPVDDPLATPAALFTRLYDLSSGSPALKPEASKDSLRDSVYPDTPFSQSVQQTWSLR